MNTLSRFQRISVLSAALLIALAMAGGALAMSHLSADDACKYCGMDLKKFVQTAMRISYDDGSEVRTCSIHCAAIDLALNIDKTPTDIMVGDYNSKELTDAEAAHWVVGGDKPGVMSKRAKWAFMSKDEAAEFVKEHGGEIAAFDIAMSAAYMDMYADTKMIREKRKMKKHSK